MTELTQEQRVYLHSRGYDDHTIEVDGVFGVREDTVVSGRRIKDCAGCVGWVATSMGGQTIGVQTRELAQKKYRWHQLSDTEHLPPVFATAEDWDILWRTGSVVITEGPFDRLAVKLALPDRAVIARLSKGTSNQLKTTLRRYVDTIWTIFDQDEPGKEATEATERALKEYMTVNRFLIPAKDPSQMLTARGVKNLRACLVRQLDVMGS